MDEDRARRAVARYYSATARRHGATPAGVDWASAEGQALRFAMLLRLCDLTGPFSLNDIGCGYGALLTYLRHRHPAAEIDYLGSDLSAAMIALAPPGPFVQGGAAPRPADYAVASGIFNVMPPACQDWEAVIARTLAEMASSVRRGFAVNLMTPRDEPRLYGTRPDPWVRHCAALGARVEVLAGYGLAEFTLLVWR